MAVDNSLSSLLMTSNWLCFAGLRTYHCFSKTVRKCIFNLKLGVSNLGIFLINISLKFILIIRAGIYLIKVNNRDTRTRCGIFSKFTIKTPKRRYWLYHSIAYLEQSLRKLKDND